MPTTNATIGKGTTLEYADRGGSNYASLGELVDVKMPEFSIGKVEATNYESPDETKEFLCVKWKEYSDVDFELNYFKTHTNTINGIAGADKDFKITLPDASTYVFPGFVSKLGGEIPNQGKISQKGAITIAGTVVFTPGT